MLTHELKIESGSIIFIKLDSNDIMYRKTIPVPLNSIKRQKTYQKQYGLNTYQIDHSSGKELGWL